MATENHFFRDAVDAPVRLRLPEWWTDLRMKPDGAKAKVALLWAVVVFQGISAAVFVWELWTEVLGLRSFQLPWFLVEIIQLGASVGLTLGFIVTSLFLRSSMRTMRDMRQQIDVASGNFQVHVQNYFEKWGFSPSEVAVATYAMKGFSNSEIADLRGTSSSTVKSQMQAVFRKSNLANRQQLISFLVEELMSGVTAEMAEAEAEE